MRSLTARTYLFAIACVLLVMLSQATVLPLLMRREHAVRRSADDRVLVQAIDALPPERATSVIAELGASGWCDLALLDGRGALLASGGAPIELPDAAALAALRDRPSVVLGETRVAHRLPRGDRILVVQRGRLPLPISPLALVLAIVAVVLLVSSWWFARGLVRPLRQLAGAARALGDGDFTVRATLDRRDELGAVGRAFDEMANRIAALLASQRTLLAGVSHELRTPMSRIHVALDLAAEDPGAAQELLAGVGDDLAELERLVNDIMTMTRLEAGARAPLRDETIAPSALVEQAAARWRTRHGDRPLDLSIDDDLPTFRGDAMMLRRVLDNLLDNAVRHGGAGPIRLRVRREGEMIAFEIADHGRGLSAEELALAFTPFWRSDESRTRDTGGTGLGLPLARQIARAHGGDVVLDSRVGEGTTATLRVPIAALKHSETSP